MPGLKTASVALIEFESEKDDALAMDVLLDAGESYSSGGAEHRILISTTAMQALRENDIKFAILTDTSVGKASKGKSRSAH
jgi:hypothetical protein